MQDAITDFDEEHDFLSNFYEAEILYEGIIWQTSEHAYQAAKTTDKGWRNAIQDAATPGRAKRLGRKVPLRADWEEVKLGIMKEIQRRKFTQWPTLKEALLATGDAMLIEGNNHGDRTWGAELVDGEWVGDNFLGKILMEVRKELKEEARNAAQ